MTLCLDLKFDPGIVSHGNPSGLHWHRMDRPWLHRYSIVLAVCSLALVVTGAFMPMPPTHDSARLERIHQWTAVPVVILAAGLAIWLSVADKRVWLRRLGWIVLATVILQGALGSAAPGSR